MFAEFIIGGIAFQATISLGVVILGLLVTCAAGFAIWRTQSVAALRQAAEDVRKDRDDWQSRYEATKTDLDDYKVEARQDRDRQDQKIADLSATCTECNLEIARLRALTDTSHLAKDEVLSAFREEVQLAIARREAVEQQKFDLIAQQGAMIEKLIERLPISHHEEGDAHVAEAD